MRHSFISYRVAEVQNVNQVALEAGNSPQMIFRHYRELVRPKEAKRWFSIEPDGKGKLIYLQSEQGKSLKTDNKSQTSLHKGSTECETAVETAIAE